MSRTIVVDPSGQGDFVTLEAAWATFPKSGPVYAAVYLADDAVFFEPTVPLRSALSVMRTGDGVNPPTIVPYSRTFNTPTGVDIEGVRISGLRFYGPEMDTRNPANDGKWDRIRQWKLSVAPGRAMRDVVIEYCDFAFCMSGGEAKKSDPGLCEGIVWRRNRFHHAWAYIGDLQQNVKGNGQPSLWIENLFYHGGFGSDRTSGAVLPDSTGKPSADIRSHNVYITDGSGYTFRRNVFILPSSIGLKVAGTELNGTRNLVIEDNLFIDCQIGSAVQYQSGSDPQGMTGVQEGIAILEPLIHRNVFLYPGRSRPTNSNSAVSLWMAGFQDGEVSENITQGENLLDRRYIAVHAVTRSVGTKVVNNTAIDVLSNTGVKTWNLERLEGGTFSERPADGRFFERDLPGESIAGYAALLLGQEERNWDENLWPGRINARIRATVWEDEPQIEIEESKVKYTLTMPDAVIELKTADGTPIEYVDGKALLAPGAQVILEPVVKGEPKIESLGGSTETT